MPRLAAAVEAIFVLHLFGVEIHSSARRHGIRDGDIRHAHDQPVAWIELGDDPRPGPVPARRTRLSRQSA